MSRNEDALRLFRTLGATTAVVGQSIAGETPVFVVPVTVEALSPILTAVPMQLLAWRMATNRGIDPDTFRIHPARFKQGGCGIAL
jgi:glucosamine 6-phosphate synthetase-like amidotransferase/phosphosugar isomerase protein